MGYIVALLSVHTVTMVRIDYFPATCKIHLLYPQEGYSDIFIHTYARVIFWVRNFEFQYFFRFSEKIIFFGVWGPHKIGLYLVVISMHFRVFLKVKVQYRGYFLGLPKFQIFFGVLEIPDFFDFFFFGGGGGGGEW